MELKVWVDGIQRVVCGANLTTTCQDVVMALAHAMGRTGRFTLIEKWRESERPLTPGECPLQSLHKWGEYAAEVRFYLMQSEQQEKLAAQSTQNSKHHSLEMEVGYSHNFTPPLPALATKLRQQQQQLPMPSVVSSTSLSLSSSSLLQPLQSQVDTIKRSSTFSGVHKGGNFSLPPSSSLPYSSKQDHLKQQHLQQNYQTQPTTHSLHNQLQQQNKHNSLPTQNYIHSGQQSNRIPLRTSQPHQQHNHPGVLSSQKSRNQSNQHQHQQPRPIQKTPSLPIPTQPSATNTHPHPHAMHRLNGNTSSSTNSSPRDASATRVLSLSPGRRSREASLSPHRDSRYLHPANVPRAADTYSNYSNSKDNQNDIGTVLGQRDSNSRERSRHVSDHHQQQQQQQIQPPEQPSNNNAASSPRPVPTPAPRSQHRQVSPSSHPYENLPPRRHSYYAVETSTTSTSSSIHPAREAPPHPTRRRSKSSDRTSWKSSNTPLGHLDPDQVRHRHRDKTDSHSSDGKRQGVTARRKSSTEDQLVSGSSRDGIPNNVANSNSNNNDHNFNSDLSDDCFQGQGSDQYYSKSPSLSSGLNSGGYLNEANLFKPPYSKHMASSSTYPPQFSQTLPKYSSANQSRAPTKNLDPRTAAAAKLQSLPSKNAISPPDCLRRSEGSSKVNFVESALLRQQRPSPSLDNTNSPRNVRSGSSNSNRQVQGQGESKSPRQLPSFAVENYLCINHKHQTSVTDQTTGNPTSISHPPDGHDGGYYQNPQDRQDGGPSRSPNAPAISHSTSSPEHQQQQHQNSHTHSHVSAFKVVSPRFSSTNPHHLNSSTSSPNYHDEVDTPVPYNLDNQNFDLSVNLDHHSNAHHNYNPQPPLVVPFPESTSLPSSYPYQLQSHSRQASLEIEEYDLDQNFPDVFPKDRYHASTLPRTTRKSGGEGGRGLVVVSGGKMTSSQGQGHSNPHPTEYLMDRPKSSSMEPEYTRMLRQVKMQQEHLKMVEALVSELVSEIVDLETEQSGLDLKLDVVTTEISSLERAEEKNISELDDLDRVEWVNVLDGEVKCERDLTDQMTKLKVELTLLKEKIGETKEKEKTMAADLEIEKNTLEEQVRQKREEAACNEKRLMDARTELSKLEKVLAQKHEEMAILDGGLTETNDKLQSQEKEAERLEELLRDENLKDFQANPVPKQPPPPTSTATTTTSTQKSDPPPATPSSSSPGPSTLPSRPPSETGEAILKLLEGRLSPRVSPSPTTNSSIAMTTPTATQHSPFLSQTAVKNPNGVWV